jgi:signal recognition particle receptor subunit beta
MVQVKDGNILFKILYWGPAASGKTTCLETLRKYTQIHDLEVKPIRDLKEISMASGATLYFDHGIFQSTQDPKLFYHTYTVAGQSRFGALRKKVLEGVDGIIIVFDSNSPRWEDCVNSVKELRNLIGQESLAKMPLVVLLNKKDLPSVITVNQVKELLRQQHLWSDDPEQAARNPQIYETIALFDKKSNVYESFYQVAKRTIDQAVEILQKS